MRIQKTGNMEFLERVEWKNIMLRKKQLRGCAQRRKNNYIEWLSFEVHKVVHDK